MSILIKQHYLDRFPTSKDGIKLIKVDKNLSIEDYIKLYTKTVSEKGKKNSYQKILPFLDDAKNLKKENVDYLFPYQTIIIEYDQGSLEFQEERIRATAEVINTSSFFVYSGNKSNHHFMFFKNFAANAEEYKKKCFELLTFLAHTLPGYYAYPKGSTKTDKLVPDTTLFRSEASARQYGGIHDNGKKQQGTIINSGKVLKIDDFLMEKPEKPRKKKNGSYKNDSSNIVYLPHEKEKNDLSPEETKFVDFFHSLILNQNYTCSDESVASVIIYRYKDRIRTIKGNKDIPLAIFDNGWKPGDKSIFTRLCRELSVEIAKLKKVISSKYSKESKNNKGADFVDSTISYLKNMSSINPVREYIDSFPEVSTKMSDWDNNPNILMLEDEYVEFTPEDASYNEITPDNLCLLSTHIKSIKDINKPKCPKFDKALSEIFNNNENLISYFWRSFSYMLLGNNDEQVVYLYIGKGGNGKSVIATLQSKILGDYATTLAFNTIEKKRNDNSNNFDVMLLKQRRIAIAAEKAPGTVIRSQFLKQISSSEGIAGRDPHEKYGNFECTAKIIICANQLPFFDDKSDGMFRRLHIVPFTQTFDNKNNNRNINLLKDLMEEKEDILAKAILKYFDYLEEGLNPTAEIKDMLKIVRDGGKPAKTFINNYVKIDLNGEITSKDLYMKYVEWSNALGLTPETMNSFGRRMTDKYSDKRIKSGTNIYRGITFTDVEDLLDEVEEIKNPEFEDVLEIA